MTETSEFNQVVPSAEVKGQEKELFDAIRGALRRPNASEVQTRDGRLRKLIVLKSPDGQFQIVADARISVIENESDVDNMFGDRDSLAPYFQKHHFEEWDAGNIVNNVGLIATLLPKKEDVDRAIYFLKNGEPETELQEKCVNLLTGDEL